MLLSSSRVTTFTRLRHFFCCSLGFSDSTRNVSTVSLAIGFTSTSLFNSATASTALALSNLGHSFDEQRARRVNIRAIDVTVDRKDITNHIALALHVFLKAP